MAENQYYYNSSEYKQKLEETLERKEEFDREMSLKTEQKQKNYEMEKRKLRRIFTEERCGKENMHFVRSLIERAAFLRSELEFIEDQIQEGSILDMFVQGTQILIREHPLSKLHVQYMKIYKEVITKLEAYGKESRVDSSGDDNSKESENLTGLIMQGANARGKYKK